MKKTYKNPVLIGADPFMLQHGAKYYLYPMWDEVSGFRVYESWDMIEWTDRGVCLSLGDVKGENLWLWLLGARGDIPRGQVLYDIYGS